MRSRDAYENAWNPEQIAVQGVAWDPAGRRTARTAVGAPCTGPGGDGRRDPCKPPVHTGQADHELGAPDVTADSRLRIHGLIRTVVLECRVSTLTSGAHSVQDRGQYPWRTLAAAPVHWIPVQDPCRALLAVPGLIARGGGAPAGRGASGPSTRNPPRGSMLYTRHSDRRPELIKAVHTCISWSRRGLPIGRRRVFGTRSQDSRTNIRADLQQRDSVMTIRTSSAGSQVPFSCVTQGAG